MDEKVKTQEPEHGIPEKSSGNKKRGRPKSFIATQADGAMGRNLTEKGHRSRVNAVYRQAWLKVAFKCDPENFQRIFGASKEELQSGAKDFPAGWQTEGESIGRALVDGSVDAEQVLEIVLKARENKIPAGQIAAHFRNLRLGQKSGNSVSLVMALARTLDRYQIQFAATTQAQRIAAVESLLEIVAEDSQREAAK